MNDMSMGMPAPLLFSDNAAAKVKSLIEEEGNNDLMLRVFVTGGGCSGLQYGFTFDEVTNDDDTIMEKNGVQAAHRPHELPVSGGRRNRLQRRVGRCAVRDQEPERLQYLRLRIVLLGLSANIRKMKRAAWPPFSFCASDSGGIYGAQHNGMS